MRLWFIYILFFALTFSSLAFMQSVILSPEEIIIGTWKEKKWEYETSGIVAGHVLNIDTMSQGVKEQLGQHHLIIHSAETWKFLPKGGLLLKGKGFEKKVKWKLKGRGHILELEYPEERVTEHYNITELNKNEMVLNFDSDIQVTGIAKLTFYKHHK